MGIFGKTIFDFNFKLFGVLCYLYPIAISYLAYLYYRDKLLNLRYLEICLASITLFLLLLILQASAFGLGLFGNAMLDFLEPNLGKFGVWILACFGIGLCVLSLKDKDMIELFKELRALEIRQTIKRCFGSAFSLSLAFLKQMISQVKLKAYPKITHSPLINPIPLPPKKEEEAHQILSPHKIQGAVMPKNEKIHIQEFVISSKQEQQKGDIRILEGIAPQKQNPFLHHPLPDFQSQGISTSAELIQRIKNQQNSEQKPNSNPLQASPIQTEISQSPASQSLSKQELPPQEESLQEEHINFSTQSISSCNSHDESLYTSDTICPDTQTATQNFQSPEPPKEISLEENKSNPVEKTQNLPKVRHIKSLEENEALLQDLDKGKLEIPKDYKLPPISLLAPAPEQSDEIDENEIDAKIESLLEKLSVFKIDGDVIRTYSGPIITTFEFRPAPNVKVSRIQSLENDIAMALEAKSIRIQAPIPGKNVVGIEIPNSKLQTIYLREIFESEIFQSSSSPLTLALGKDVVGKPFITDLKKLPHLLIAGTTGSGKSVGVNAMILSLLYRNSPDDLKLMMVDPKMVEFMPYSDLPHLITPIITDPKKAVIGLANAVREMERRYSLMSQSRTKEIVSYNQKAKELGLEPFPYFVIIIDELADLMMTAGKEVEYSMARIAQMGRASGMHLIVATQSPRAEVLTGLIKTNLPAHLSYKVGTKIDAGIIGCSGAETLLGRGDMLFTPPGVSGLVRLHAPWSSEDEVNEIVSYIKTQRETLYDPAFLPEEKEVFGALDPMDLDEETSELLNRAKEIILQDGKTSISYLQRRLSIGYNKAATLIEKLEQIGFLSEADAKGNRQIL